MPCGKTKVLVVEGCDISSAVQDNFEGLGGEIRTPDVVSCEDRQQADPRLTIVHLSIHGLVRGAHLELGCNADTGGQVKFVVELARHTAARPDVREVVILTRQIVDNDYSVEYSSETELVCPQLRIVRLACGPPGYIVKEKLWPYLDEFADRALQFIGSMENPPDILHAHYADAATVAAHLSSVLGVSMVLTTHSLGQQKKRQLLQQGSTLAEIEEKYSMEKRIEAEEVGFDHARMVFVSTSQELNVQCAAYNAFRADSATVILPGVHLPNVPSRDPLQSQQPLDQPTHVSRMTGAPTLVGNIHRFLKDASKRVILLVARPVVQKNAVALIRAFGGSPQLRQEANLVLVMGQRQELRVKPQQSESDAELQEVILSMLAEVDNYDLYGSVAYPKCHVREEVSEVYSWAAERRGVFVNPSLNEPFGLTLLEAAAHGLPVVATKEGGPLDIVGTLDNGILVDPRSPSDIARGIQQVFQNDLWDKLAANGKAGIQQFSWDAHTKAYMQHLQKIAAEQVEEEKVQHSQGGLEQVEEEKVQHSQGLDSKHKYMIASDLDHTLIGPSNQLQQLMSRINAVRDSQRYELAVVIATGRGHASACTLLAQHSVRWDAIIACSGTQIWHANRSGGEIGGPWEDIRYKQRVSYAWNLNMVVSTLSAVRGLCMQPEANQTPFKVCFYMDDERAPSNAEIHDLLRRAGMRVRISCTRRRFLDVVPVRASKGCAMRYLAKLYGLRFENIMTAGDSGEDVDMLVGAVQGTVVGNAAPEMSCLEDRSNVFFAAKSDAAGIMEAWDHFSFAEEIGDGDDSPQELTSGA